MQIMVVRITLQAVDRKGCGRYINFQVSILFYKQHQDETSVEAMRYILFALANF